METIEHLVLSGSGPNLILQLACLKHFYNNNTLIPSKLKSVYGVSAGATLGVFVILGIPIDEIINYAIERPWDKVFAITVDNLLECNDNGGLWSPSVIRDVIVPFLYATDTPLDITLSQFYEKYPIDLHVIVTELEGFCSIDMNHHDYPTMKLLDVLQMSCLIPIMFSPFIYEGKHYVDGGVTENYPLQRCLDRVPVEDHNKVLGIRIYKRYKPKEDIPYTTIYILQFILKQLLDIASKNRSDVLCKYDILCEPDYSLADPRLWKLFTSGEEERKQMLTTSITYIEKLFSIVETGGQELIQTSD